MNIEIKNRYEIGEELYHMYGNKIEVVKIVGIEITSRTYDETQTDRESRTAIEYCIGYPKNPRGHLDWIAEDTLESYYYSDLAILVASLMDKIK